MSTVIVRCKKVSYVTKMFALLFMLSFTAMRTDNLPGICFLNFRICPKNCFLAKCSASIPPTKPSEMLNSEQRDSESWIGFDRRNQRMRHGI